MKKNHSIKVRPVYKILALSALLGVIPGCKSYEHDNVVLDIQSVKRPNMALIRDLQDSTERIVVFNDGYKMDYNISKTLRVGDTVTITVGGIYSDSLYLKNRVLYRPKIGFKQKRSCLEHAIFEAEMAKFDSLKQQIKNTNIK